MDLHEETGLLTLRECGLYDGFLKYTRFDGEAIKVCNKNMVYYISFGGTTSSTSRGRPEIDRQKLRLILLESLPTESIHWGCRVRNVDEDLNLHFADGIKKGFDLVVGADGAWSKPQSLLMNKRPYYSGVFSTYFKISDCEAASLISTVLSTTAASSPFLTAAPSPRSKWATSPSGWAPLVSSPQITRTPVGMMSMMRSRRRRHSWPSTKIDRPLCERSSRPQTTTTPWANLCICSPSAIDGRIARASP